MYSIGIVTDCMSRKIIRPTPNRNNLFGRKMKSSLNYLFIRLTDVIVRNKHRELQLLLKLENGDVRCNQYIAWLLEIYHSSFLKNSLFFRPTLMHTKNLYENGPNPFFSGFFNLMGTRMVQIRMAKSV